MVEVNLLGAWRTARAALAQISARGGQLVFLGSIYSFSNGMLGSSYAVSKAGVESLGRSLRAELAPFGASATIAYFGWVQTDLVRGALDRRGGARMLEQILPRVLLRRIGPEAAATALVDGLERRAARVYAPPVWRYLSALRGLVGPLSDRRLERDEAVRATVRQAEAEGNADAEPPVS